MPSAWIEQGTYDPAHQRMSLRSSLTVSSRELGLTPSLGVCIQIGRKFFSFIPASLTNV